MWRDCLYFSALLPCQHWLKFANSNELRKAEIASVIAGVVVFEESDCNQEGELTRKGQEPFRLKRNFGLQTKNVN